MALGMALKFYTSEAKGVTLKFRKSLGLISTFVGISPPPPPPKKKKWWGGGGGGGFFDFFKLGFTPCNAE